MPGDAADVLGLRFGMVEAVANDDPLIGATLGGLYRVERLIGVGGMGRVYRATHTLLGKDYAIKVLPEGRADKPEATERFLREARSVTKVEHELLLVHGGERREVERRGGCCPILPPQRLGGESKRARLQ